MWHQKFKNLHLIVLLTFITLSLGNLRTQNLNPLLGVIEKLGGWPVLLPNWDEKSFDWKKWVSLANNLGYSNEYLIPIEITLDEKNSSHLVIQVSYRSKFVNPNFVVRKLKFYIQLDNTGMSFDSNLMAQGLSNIIVRGYFRYMVDVAVTLGANKKEAEKELREALNFQIEMAKVSLN